MTHQLDADLDVAIAQQAYRVGRENLRPVRCRRCGRACLPGQAHRVHLRAWWGRSIFLCDAGCLPQRGTR